MIMHIQDKIVYGSSYKTGFQEVSLASGKTLKIKASADEILNAEVPEGKSWVVKISVEIVETPN